MNFFLTTAFQKRAKKLCQKDPLLRVALMKQFALFQTNDRHPSLRLHKLKGKRSTQCAIWIKDDLRAIAIRSGDHYIFYDLITHDDY